MVAVVSLLDAEHSKIVNDIISELEINFNISGVKITPYPHITWLISEIDKLAELKHYLKQAAQSSDIIHVSTAGLGIFPGEQPVIFVPVIRADNLNKFHARLFEDINAFSTQTVQFYNPSYWIPHISLALHDTDPQILPELIAYLNQRTYNWKIALDNITILKKEGDYFSKEASFQLRNSVEVV